MVRRSMDAAVKFKSERPQPQQQTAGLKRKKTPAERTQERKKRRQRQSERRREKEKVEEKERDDEEDRWHEMSCAFVEEESMRKAVAWREGRQCLRAWRAVNHWRVTSGEWWVEPETKEAEEPTENAAVVEAAVIETGGWCES